MQMKKLSVKKWIKETFKRYGELVLEEPFITLFLVQIELKREKKWQ